MDGYSSYGFNQVNNNGDSFVTKAEMADFVNKATLGYLSYDECKELAKDIIKTADIDGNGKMSLGEFALYGEDHQEINRIAFESKYGSEETNKLFNQYDTNKDGKITSDEIKSVDKANDKSNGLSTGAIIGIVIGAICLMD